jgi:hypothetical protein
MDKLKKFESGARCVILVFIYLMGGSFFLFWLFSPSHFISFLTAHHINAATIQTPFGSFTLSTLQQAVNAVADVALVTTTPADSSKATTDQTKLGAKLIQLTTEKSTAWVYLGATRDNVWIEQTFAMASVPQPGKTVTTTAITDVYKHDAQPRELQNGTWSLGTINGIVNKGDQVTLSGVVSIAGTQKRVFWWGEILPQ